jgi:multidrug efflux pump subunit AcrB
VTLSEVSIRNPVFAWMLMAALIVFGWLCFNRLGVSQLPDVEFPVVSISLSLEGAAPEVMEIEVVDPVEDAITSVQGVVGISSSSRTGSASVTVDFELDKDIDIAIQDIQNALSQVMRRLPKEVDPPTVRKSNPESQPILWLAVASETMSSQELMVFVRDQVKDRFSTIEGVGDVFLGGYVDPSLRVWVSAKKLHEYALSAGDIVDTIRGEHVELPAGRIETKEKEFNVRTLGEAPSAEEFGRINISRRGGAPNFRPLALSQIATIEDGVADIRSRSRSGGKTAIGMGIRKQPGANAVVVATKVKAALAEIEKQLPAGVSTGIRFDSTTFIKEAVEELNLTLVLSALLTALVCWLFLGSWSATLNVILAIPTSVIGCFIALYALGFTLNTFTLLALSLAIGIVVDDAIMVLENIVRHQEMGKSRVRASLDGAKEITFSALAATVAIIAIFLPVAFMKGIIGKFFFQFGVALSVAVALSLVEALTLTPMRCSRFLAKKERVGRVGKWVDHVFARSERRYRELLKWSLGHRWSWVLGSFVFFGLSLLVQKGLKKEFVPAQDQSRLMARIQAPVGSSLEYTDEKMKLVEKYFNEHPAVAQTFSSIGGFGGGEVNTGMVFLTLKEPSLRPIDPKTGKRVSQAELVNVFREGLKPISGVKAFIQDPSLSGFTSKRGFPVEFTVRGPEFQTLIESVSRLKEALQKTGVVSDIDTDYREGMPEIQVVPNREKARARGVSILEIAQTINTLMGGVVAGKYSKGGHRYDVRVRLLPRIVRNRPTLVYSAYAITEGNSFHCPKS